MNLGTLASMGKAIYSNRDAIGGIAQNFGMKDNKAFGKIMAQLPAVSHVLNKLDDAVDAAGKGNANAPGLTLNTMKQFDTDKDGTITQSELIDGLSQMQLDGLDQSAAGKRLYNAGEQLLKNYDQTSQLDGVAGLSMRDIGLLAASDQRLSQ